MKKPLLKISNLITAFVLSLFLAMTVSTSVADAAEAGIAADLFVYVPFGDGRSVNISLTDVGGRTYLFLPSDMPASRVVFHYDSESEEIRFTDGTVLTPDTTTDISRYLSKDTGDGSRILIRYICDAVSQYSRNIHKQLRSGSRKNLCG